jgi:hypothetical protein
MLPITENENAVRYEMPYVQEGRQKVTRAFSRNMAAVTGD